MFAVKLILDGLKKIVYEGVFQEIIGSFNKIDMDQFFLVFFLWRKNLVEIN